MNYNCALNIFFLKGFLYNNKNVRRSLSAFCCYNDEILPRQACGDDNETPVEIYGYFISKYVYNCLKYDG